MVTDVCHSNVDFFAIPFPFRSVNSGGLIFSFPSRRSLPHQVELIANRCKLPNWAQLRQVAKIGAEMRSTSEKEKQREVEFTISLSELMVLWDHISQILLRFDAISRRWDVCTTNTHFLQLGLNQLTAGWIKAFQLEC